MAAAIPNPEITRMRSGSGIAIKLGYSIGNLGKSIVWTTFDTFLLYYLVRIAGFSTLVAGGLLTAALLWDGCADVAVAYLADRHGRPSALGRLILLGAPLCGMGFWMIFALDPVDWHQLIVAAVLLCRIGYTLCDIGHNTLLVRLAATARDATTVSGMRLIFSAMGAGLVGLAATATLRADHRHWQASLSTAAMIGGAAYVVTLLIAVRATRHLSAAAIEKRPSSVKAIFRALLRNRQYSIVLCLIGLQASLIPLFNRALPFVGEATHGSAGWAGTALTVITLSQALSLPAWMTLARWRSPNALLAFGYVAMIVALGLQIPQSGGAIGLVGLSLLGVSQAGMNMAIWALLALSIRNGAADLVGNEALPVGLFLAVLKGSAGIGNGLLAVAVAAGNQFPIVLVAIILPILACMAGLSLIIWFSPAIASDGKPMI